MRITYLVEVADQIWGGVKVALEDANWLAGRGHEVTILSRSGPPTWMQLRCAFRTVPDFAPEHVPSSDLIVATFSLRGPERCSGLDVVRYDGAALGQELGAGFRLVRELDDTHVTPKGKEQSFVHCLFRRTVG